MADVMFGFDLIDAGLLPAILIALTAGIISFLSPCVLPIVPPYLAYMSGVTLNDMSSVAAARRKAETLRFARRAARRLTAFVGSVSATWSMSTPPHRWLVSGWWFGVPPENSVMTHFPRKSDFPRKIRIFETCPQKIEKMQTRTQQFFW